MPYGTYKRPRRSVYTPGYFGLAQHRHEFPRRSVYTPGYFGLADTPTGGSSQPGDNAKDEIMDGYASTWGWDPSYSQPSGPVTSTGDRPSSNGNGEEEIQPNGEEPQTQSRPSGTPELEQIAIWGTVGLLGYFLIGPFLGLKS